jgi:hypothetical protein
MGSLGMEGLALVKVVVKADDLARREGRELRYTSSHVVYNLPCLACKA